MNNKEINFINKLHNSMGAYKTRNLGDKLSGGRAPLTKSIKILVLGLIDLVSLFWQLRNIRKKRCNIYYTHSCFIKPINKHFDDNLYGDLLKQKNSIFISYDRYDYYKKVSNIKVFNLGIVIKILQKIKIIKRTTEQLNTDNWLFINEAICKHLNNNDIYIPAYSNEVGFSLVFNKYRNRYKLIEIQHGSVINYPPYSFISELPLVDIFYYRNESSKLFLERNLFSKIPIILKPLKKDKINLQPSTEFTEILYISSYEFNTIHPVFAKFLRCNPKNCHIRIRLHPRQSSLESFFISALRDLNCNFEIDKSKNWYTNIPENTIVISPLSSVIEEAVDNKLLTIIIDETGASRYNYLIDNKHCYYSQDLFKLLNELNFIIC